MQGRRYGRGGSKHTTPPGQDKPSSLQPLPHCRQCATIGNRHCATPTTELTRGQAAGDHQRSAADSTRSHVRQIQDHRATKRHTDVERLQLSSR